MKHTISIFLFALCFLSCKRSTAPLTLNSYACTLTDSIYSNIPKLNSITVTSQYHSDETQPEINLLMAENTKTDTLFFRNDSLEQEYWTMVCILQ